MNTAFLNLKGNVIKVSTQKSGSETQSLSFYSSVSVVYIILQKMEPSTTQKLMFGYSLQPNSVNLQILSISDFSVSKLLFCYFGYLGKHQMQFIQIHNFIC